MRGTEKTHTQSNTPLFYIGRATPQSFKQKKELTLTEGSPNPFLSPCCKLFSNSSSVNSSRINSGRINSGRVNSSSINRINRFNSYFFNNFSRLSSFIAARSERHCKCNSEEQN